MKQIGEDLWPLPESWSWAPIGAIAEVVGGGTPSTTDPLNFGGDIPWVTPADMSQHFGKSILGGLRSISKKGLSNSGAHWLPKGSVLFSSRAPIGYVAIAAVPLTTNQGFKSFVPTIGVTSDFLYHWLTSAKPIAEKLASGTTFLEISGAKAALIPFPLAPLAEQTRIVDKLEELLSDLDAGVAELKAAQKKLAQYRQSLLKAAVEGRLTQTWRAQHGNTSASEESGAQLLTRILRERRARWEAKQLAKFEAQGKAPAKGWQNKYPEPSALDSTSLSELPHNWVWASLDMLIDEGPQNGLYLPSDRYGRGCSILRIDDFQNGWVRARNELNLVDADAVTLATYSLNSGDVVVNRVNSMTHLGKTLVVDTVLGGALFESNMMRCSLHSAVNPQYVGAYLGSELGRNRLIRDAKWAVNQASINQQDVKRTPVPLAPFDEQDAIVDVVRRALSSSEDQLNAINHALRQSAAQRKNILQAAFSGQLVPQDPNDEPASVLLARIRAERASQPANLRKPRASSKAADTPETPTSRNTPC